MSDTSFIFILCWLSVNIVFILQTVQASTVSVMGYDFGTRKSKSLPPGDIHYTSETARSLTACVARCARDPNCQSLHATSANHAGQVTCSLLAQVVPDEDLVSGTGTYVYLRGIATRGEPPSFSRGTLVEIAQYNEGLVAVYDFSSSPNSVDTFGVMYDFDRNKWPEVSEDCAVRLWYVRGLSATVVSIMEETPGYSYRMTPHCQHDEAKWGDAMCSSNGYGWSISGDAGVACVSTSCYRVNSQGRAQYGGTTSRTRYGTGCSQWSSSYYSSSYFPLDNYNKGAAENYCRDPSGRGRPWCNIYPYYDFCNVPRCSRSPGG